MSLRKLNRALSLFAPERMRIALAILLLLLSVAANLLKPWPFALMVDSVLRQAPDTASAQSATGTIAFFSIIILVLHLLHAAFSSGQNYLSITAGLAGLARVRRNLFARLQQLSLRYYHGTNQGDVIYRATWDTYAFQTLFQQGLFVFLNAFLSLGVMIVVMWRVNVPLTLVSLGTFPFLLGAMFFFGKRMQHCSRTAHEADSSVASATQQTIQTLPLIQSYTREAHEAEQFNAQVQNAFSARSVQHRWEVLYGFCIAVIFGFGTAAIVWIGSAEVVQGRLSVGKLLIFVAYLAQLYDPLNQLSRVGGTVADASASVERVFELLDTNEEVRDSPEAKPIARAQGRIQLEHVSFGYTAERMVLKDVTFEMAPGESLAIIGPSGAGKTTLLGLLTRFYDPAAGSVKLDGHELRELKLHDLRSNISLVLQEPLLLRATVAENIAYGKPTASRPEIESAARKANAHEFIAMLPQQYETIIGEGAARLSVGEKQRINLARAFLKDAPVLLLDEPTSALDADTENLVTASLAELMRSRTTIVVAHRLSTIRKVNRILVLEDGRIEEVGSPAQLLASGGYYARVNAASQS